MAKEVIVKFEASKPEDLGGVRLRTLSPKGVYASGRDAEETQAYFMQSVTSLVGTRGLLDTPEPGGIVAQEPDWEEVYAVGKGEVTVKFMTMGEIEAFKEEPGSREVVHAIEKTEVDVWENNKGDQMWVVRDIGSVDSWIVDMLQRDMQGVH